VKLDKYEYFIFFNYKDVWGRGVMAPFILNIKAHIIKTYGVEEANLFLLNSRHYMDVQSYHCALMKAPVPCG
jgi:hypothetical protein